MKIAVGAIAVGVLWTVMIDGGWLVWPPVLLALVVGGGLGRVLRP